MTALAVLGLALLWAAPAIAQGIDPEGRLVRAVEYEGLESTPKALVKNAIRTTPGTVYKKKTIEQDIVRLTFLGRFDTVQAKVKPNADGSINVIYEFKEQKALLSIQFQGNANIDSDDLETLVLLREGDPIDRSLIDRGARSIQLAYAEKGYFAATVTYDKKALKDKQRLIYKVTEGPLVRILEFRFDGNKIFDDDRLDDSVNSDRYIWPFYAGFMDRTKLDQDTARIRDYYLARGYLDAQVGRRIELSPRQHRAIVTFVITEGKKHTVRDIKVRFTKDGAPTDDQLMAKQQIPPILALIEGGVYTEERLKKSEEAVQLWYGDIGFINTKVKIDQVFDPDKSVVDVVVEIEEGTGPTMVGDVTIIGLSRTQQKVLLRRIRGMEPGRPVTLRGLQQTRDLVRESIWFANGKITPLGSPDDPVRDFLIEASEKNTGTFSIGAGLSSDLGVFGAISLTQRNFDIADTPESIDEFLSQRAFLGAGQTFNITLAPGNDNSSYSVSFSEPYLFESDYFFDINLSAFDSVREDFDEGRAVINTSVGKRLGDIWTGSARMRVEAIDIGGIEPSAPVDVFNVAGNSTLTALGFTLLRSTTDSNILPSSGSRFSLSVNQFGALGGDFTFTRFNGSYDKFWSLDEDYLGRKTILSFKVDAGYIPQSNSEVPLFERLYSGGRDFRGFAFRGAGPRGVRNDTMTLGDDPVGGRFSFVTRTQYEVPIFQDVLRWAFFTDQGTVQDDFGFDQWRVSVGTGVRIKIPFFGQAPIALDLGFPILKEDGDETQVLSFSFEFPFN